MRISLRLKLHLILLPLVAIALFSLVYMISIYTDIKGKFEQIARGERSAVLAARLCAAFERENKEYMDVVLFDQGAWPEGGKAAESFDRWKAALDADGRSPREDLILLEKIGKKLGEVRLSERKLARLAQGGEDRSLAVRLVRSELEPLLDSALPAAEIDDYVFTREKRIREVIAELNGSIEAVSLFRTPRTRAELEDLSGDIAAVLRIQEFSYAVTRQVRGYEELLVGGGVEEIRQTASGESRARALLEEWRGLIAGREANEGSHAAEIEGLETIENRFLRFSQSGELVVALYRRGMIREARAVVEARLFPLYGEIQAAVGTVDALKEKEIDEGLRSLMSRVARRKVELALLSLVVLAVGVGSPLLLMKKIVHPVLALKDLARQVGAGRLQARVDIDSQDEIGELADSFNEMTRSLAGTTVSKDYFDNIIRSILSGIIVMSPDGRILTANRAASAMLDASEEDLDGRPAAEILGIDPEEAARWIGRVVGEESVSNMEMVLKGRTGSEVHAILSGSVVRGPDGSVVSIVCAVQDITDRNNAERALWEANERLQIWIGDLERRNKEIRQINRLAELLQSCLSVEEAYEVIKSSAGNLLPGTSGALGVLQSTRNIVESVVRWGDEGGGDPYFDPEECWGLRRGKPHVVESPDSAFQCRHVGKPTPGRYLCIPMMAQGETIGMLHVRFEDGRDMAEKEAAIPESVQTLVITMAGNIALAINNLKLRAKLRDQVIRDSLTGLYNRRYMEETLERELIRAKRSGERVGIIMIDIDNFKAFNDTCGHAAGDVILREFGKFLRSRVRGSDIACRYGGEEFTLVLPDVSVDVTIARAENLREGVVLAMRPEHQGYPLGSITISIGIAFFPEHGESADAVIQAADRALYRAKAEGKDRVVVADPLAVRPS